MKTFYPSPLKFIAAFALLACALLAPRAFAQEGSGKLELMFNGSGTVTASQTSFENKYNFKTKSYQSGTVTSTGKKPFTGSGYVEISNGTARIKLPSAMKPLISSDQNGWFAINDFFMNDTEITGLVKINGLNKPKLRIDRGTGIITIANGLNDFTGTCELVTHDPAKRKF
jgi:hypothetical protein